MEEFRQDTFEKDFWKDWEKRKTWDEIQPGELRPAVEVTLTKEMIQNFARAIGDMNPIYFDEEFREISLMLLCAKARWQVAQMGRFAEKVIIFIDEPILSALGSTSYVGVSNEEALRLLRETSEAIRGVGGIPGIHCCGRADWPLVMDSGVDIMNFDAYAFADTLGIYPGDVEAFLDAGGLLAWGIVPTTEDINNETLDSIERLFKGAMGKLSKNISRELLMNNIMLTPSCGMGSRTVEEKQKIFKLLSELKEAMLR